MPDGYQRDKCVTKIRQENLYVLTHVIEAGACLTQHPVDLQPHFTGNTKKSENNGGEKGKADMRI